MKSDCSLSLWLFSESSLSILWMPSESSLNESSWSHPEPKIWRFKSFRQTWTGRTNKRTNGQRLAFLELLSGPKTTFWFLEFWMKEAIYDGGSPWPSLSPSDEWTVLSSINQRRRIRECNPATRDDTFSQTTVFRVPTIAKFPHKQ